MSLDDAYRHLGDMEGLYAGPAGRQRLLDVFKAHPNAKAWLLARVRVERAHDARKACGSMIKMLSEAKRRRSSAIVMTQHSKRL